MLDEIRLVANNPLVKAMTWLSFGVLLTLQAWIGAAFMLGGSAPTEVVMSTWLTIVTIMALVFMVTHYNIAVRLSEAATPTLAPINVEAVKARDWLADIADGQLDGKTDPDHATMARQAFEAEEQELAAMATEHELDAALPWWMKSD